MILQALVDYYDRRAADPNSGIAPYGWEWKALPFIIEIDVEGRLVQIADTREVDGKRQVAHLFRVPYAPAMRGSGFVATLLWDNVEFALGVAINGKPDRVVRQHRAFLDAIKNRFGDDPDDLGLRAVLQFLRTFSTTDLERQPAWPDLLATNPFVSFRLAGETDLVCNRPAIAAMINAGSSQPDGICLVTGQRTTIARLHPPIKGLNSTGGSLVSFNQNSFDSYGHLQGANSPVSMAAAFAYTAALNDLLRLRSRKLAGSTIVYWAERPDAATVENAFAQIIIEAPVDDPLTGTRAVESILDSVRSGVPITGDDDSRFFVLALAPNKTRISVQSMQVTTIKDLATAITHHFEDLAVVSPPFIPAHPSLSRSLSATAAQGKSENVPPNLAGDVIRAVLLDRPYPASLYQAAVRRARVPPDKRHDPFPFLAAWIKASLNRSLRAGGVAATRKELTVALDPDNPNPAYRLGRLFALLERAQEIARGDDRGADIRERFYAAASTSPVTVFSRLLTLSSHHLAKFDGPGRRNWMQGLIGDVMDGVDSFPARLTLDEQGLFAVGYYHQRQALYTKHEAATPDATTSEEQGGTHQ